MEKHYRFEDSVGQGSRNVQQAGICYFLLVVVVYGLYCLYCMPSRQLMGLYEESMGLLFKGLVFIAPLGNVLIWGTGIALIIAGILSPTSSRAGDFCDGGLECNDTSNGYDYY
jgi:hypothetical protein